MLSIEIEVTFERSTEGEVARADLETMFDHSYTDEEGTSTFEGMRPESAAHFLTLLLSEPFRSGVIRFKMEGAS